MYVLSDGWDWENPLQSKGRKALTSFYIYILNLDEWNRSKRNGYHTAQLVFNHQIQRYKSDKVLERMVEDMNSLQETGIEVERDIYPARFVQYRQDNLERAKVTKGFESFSRSKHFKITSTLCKAKSPSEEVGWAPAT